MILAEAVTVFMFSLIHVFGGKLRFLEGVPRSRWLSFAGGTSVAYVFLHIVPELTEAHETLQQGWQNSLLRDSFAYLVGLIGLVTFYGLERLVKSARYAPRGGEGETSTGEGVFWLHIGSFAVYNLLIGYLLVSERRQDFTDLLLFAIALGLHFLVNDFGLREDHKDTYRRKGRWLLAAAVLIGWLLGLALSFAEQLVNVLFAFLAGGIVLNVLKEELPESRESRFVPFALGALGYGLLMLAI